MAVMHGRNLHGHLVTCLLTQHHSCKLHIQVELERTRKQETLRAHKMGTVPSSSKPQNFTLMETPKLETLGVAVRYVPVPVSGALNVAAGHNGHHH